MMFPKNKRRKLSAKKYRELCEYIADRDPICQICRKRASVDVHHVIKRSQSGDDSKNNLVGLCRHCHSLVEAYKLEIPERVLEMLKNE